MKKARWRKGIVEWEDLDDPEVMNLSVVFSWDAPAAYSRAVWWREFGYRVRVGGPGVFTPKVRRMFDGVAELGGEIPDTVTRHNGNATFASRGCDVGCWFCVVPAMEGRTFTLIEDFTPRPILCDNNLSALPEDFQDHIVKRYQQTGTPLLDANSGLSQRPSTARCCAGGRPSTEVPGGSLTTKPRKGRTWSGSAGCSRTIDRGGSGSTC